MYIFKLSLILIFDIFTQIYLTEGNSSGQFYTAKSDIEECLCYPKRGSLYPELQNPHDHLLRLVVYIYKDVKTNQLKVFRPSIEKEAISYNTPMDTDDKLTAITSESIISLIKKINKVIKYGPNPSKIENCIKYLTGTTVNPNFFQLLKVYQHNYLKTQQIYPKTNDDYMNFINRRRSLFVYNHLFNPHELDNYHQINPFEINAILNTELTFDQWLIRQVKNVNENKLLQTQSQYIQTVNIGILKSLVLEVLLANQMHIDASGLINYPDSTQTNLYNLRLKYLLLRIPNTSTKALQEDLIIQNKKTFLEVILVTHLNPPKILGFIPFKNTNIMEPKTKTVTSTNIHEKSFYRAPKSLANAASLSNLNLEFLSGSSSNIYQILTASIENDSPVSSVNKQLDTGDDNKPSMITNVLTPATNGRLRRSNEKQNTIKESNQENAVPKAYLDLNFNKYLNNLEYQNQEALLNHSNEPHRRFVVENNNITDGRAEHMVSDWELLQKTKNFNNQTPDIIRQSHMLSTKRRRKRSKNNNRASEKSVVTNSGISSAEGSVSKHIDDITNVKKILKSVPNNGDILSSVGNSHSPIRKNIVKSLLGVFLHSFGMGESDYSDNHINEKQLNTNFTNPIVKTGDIEGEDRPGIKIIGGSAATSSGVPISIKGRGNFNKT